MPTFRLRLIAFALFLLSGLQLVIAQDAKEAAAALASGDFPTAIRLCQSLVQAHPEDGNGWEQLGLAYHQSGKYTEAIASFQKALDNGYAASTGQYNLACAYARAGDKQHALDLISALVANGNPLPIASDPDLQSLSEEPRFKDLLARTLRLRQVCKDPQAHPEYRQLDFWVGEWDVYAAKQEVGESSVQLILSDCVVFENWRGLGGGEGKSFNKYDPVGKKWEQFWVADSGATNYFGGQLVNGEMRYILQQPTPNGGTFMRHLTFSKLAENQVRQLSEASTDGGKTWSTEYDFTYVRKK